jgi:hypothetical protein
MQVQPTMAQCNDAKLACDTPLAMTLDRRGAVLDGVLVWMLALSVLLLGCSALPPPRSPAESLYRQRCGNCHELASPGAYTTADWRRIMTAMSVNAGLSDVQSNELLAWLTANSSDRAAAPTPAQGLVDTPRARGGLPGIAE